MDPYQSYHLNINKLPSGSINGEIPYLYIKISPIALNKVPITDKIIFVSILFSVYPLIHPVPLVRL